MEVSAKPMTIEDYGKMLLTEINRLILEGTLHQVYTKRGECLSDQEYITELAEIKRFIELWAADSELRELVKSEEELPEKYDFNINIKELRSLWDEFADFSLPPISALRYKAFNLEKLTHRNHMRANDESSIPNYNAWRSRQMKRCEMELTELTSSSIVHAPFCIELCAGCSVGCWFCGISAPKLEDIYFYTEENAALYQGVLKSMKSVFGEAAGKGFCYWATDPLDNPDYEKFMIDFHEILGVFPQTTTALPLKDVERTKRLLKLSRERDGKLDRFSILSLRQLLQVFEEFTAEELLFVELVTQNKESYGAKTNAGRAIEGGIKRASSKKNATGNQVSSGTIACVSGFLISMVERSVKLITPCMANEKWPLGYIVFDEGTFDTAEEFDTLIKKMCAEQMKLTLPLDTDMRFLSNLKYTDLSDGFSLKSEHINKSFRSNSYFKTIGQLIHQGNLKVSQIMEHLEIQFGYMQAETLYAMNQIYNEGVIKINK